MKFVLSLFSGMGALDEGFRRAGFCVVSAGDVAWSSFYDLANFHPPRGVFDGVIGGDPCQSHSALANLVRAKGFEPSFPDLTPEFCRVVDEARPRWFLRENVPKAPEIEVAGYSVATFLLDNWASLGQKQGRRRRFWFGMWGEPVFELRAHIDFALVIPPKVQSVTGRNDGEIGTTGGHRGSPARYTLDEMLDLQGLPRDIFKHSPLTMQGKRKLVGNAVPLSMSIALGKAVREAIR